MNKYQEDKMKSQENLKSEELLEQIFYYMNQLAVEKDFSASILLLTELGRILVNAERFSFWYHDKKKKSYWTLLASQIDRIEIPEGKGIVDAVIKNNETLLINEPYKDERFNPQVDKETGFLTKAILCMPVINSCGEVIGAFQAINKLEQDGKFDEQDKKRFTLIATYSGKLLETHLLRRQNQVDYLTGLKNRRGFFDYYEQKIVPIFDTAKSSIIIGDIDFFKKVNDTYGHNAGDAVLIFVADMMQKYTEKKGEVFRWGGEEFLILLPKCPLEEARLLAEQIRQNVEKSECRTQNECIKVTMSFGVKELETNKTLEENIGKVDEKLYEAKTSGRNRVII